MGWKEERT